jgi:mRNA interferase RelE/StbE
VYSVFYTSAAARQLRHLSREIRQSIEETVEGLIHTPRTLHTEKLAGYPNAYRLRAGRYRILYTIEDQVRRVVIYRIAHRREACR